MNYLFVYGTLMQNSANEFAQKLSSNCCYVGNGFIYAVKYNLGHYPGIKIDSKKETKTNGELYQFIKNKSSLLKKLDDYEGYYPKQPSKSLFTRELVTVYLPKKEYEAWVYVYNQDL